MIYVYHMDIPEDANQEGEFKPQYTIGEYNAYAKSGELYFSYKSQDGEIEYEDTFNLKEYRHKFIEIALTNGLQKNKVIPIECFDYIDRANLKFSWKSTNKKIARIVFDDTDIYIMLMHYCNDIPNVINKPIDTNMTSTEQLISVSPWFKKHIQKYNNKIGVIENVDIYSTVTYLESQVDALTKIALKLYKENDDLKNILTEADKYSVLNIKDKESIMKEIQEDKGNVRNLQKEYYEKK